MLLRFASIQRSTAPRSVRPARKSSASWRAEWRSSTDVPPVNRSYTSGAFSGTPGRRCYAAAVPGEDDGGQPGWRRTFWVLWVSQMVAMVAFAAVLPFMPLYVQALGVT